MKILVLSTNGIMNDGITAWLKATYAAMNLKGFYISTIAFDGCDQGLINQISELGIQVRQLPNRKTNIFAYMKSFHSLLMDQKYDVVHVCGNSATMAFELFEAKCAGVKMRVAHSHNTKCTHPFLDKILRPLLYFSATDYFACGKDAGRWLFGKRNFTVIPNGKNINDYAFSETMRMKKRQELGFSKNDIIIGHVGLFNEQKNHKMLIKIFNEISKMDPRYRLCLVGDGELINQIKQLVSEYGLSDYVSFLGHRLDVPQLLNAFDCMVFPSLYEGLPNVVLEWQLNGLPIVMSDSITNECVITPLVHRESLRHSALEWAKSIYAYREKNMNRLINSQNAQIQARAKGFDIYEDATFLRKIYLQYSE